MTLADLPSPTFTGADLASRVNAGLLETRAARRFATVAALLADRTMTYDAGARQVQADDVVEAGGYRYTVAASGASDHHFTTAGGVRLYVRPMAASIFAAEAFGAAGDGAADDIEALEAAVAALKASGGGVLWLHGRHALSRGLLIDGDGITVAGASSDYGSGGSGAAALVALAGFTGDYILKFEASDGGVIRSVGARDFAIHGGTTSSAHGLVGMQVYDAVEVSNLNITGIGDGYNCLRLDAPRGSVCQTVTAANVFGIHRADTNAAGAFFLRRVQEAVFTGCKGWSAASTGTTGSGTGLDINEGIPWHIESCNGLTLIACSTVATKSFGFDILAGDRGCKGINVIGPTIESVGKPLRLRSNAVEMYGAAGTFSVVAAESEVRQPADGSTATGTVYLSTVNGLYAYDITGAFATGNLYDAAGNVVGNVTSLRPVVPANIRLTSPALKGSQASGGPFTSEIQAGENIDLDWQFAADTQTVGTAYPLSISSGVTGRVRADRHASITNSAWGTCAVERIGVAGTILASEVFTAQGVSDFTIPAPVAGRQVTITHDVSGSTAAEVGFILGTGVSVLRDGVSNTGTVKLLSPGSSISLRGISATQWVVTGQTGAVRFATDLVTSPGHAAFVAATASTTTVGVRHAGRTLTNAGRGASASTFNLPALSAVYPGLMLRFVRIDAGTLRIDPGGMDEILGGTGAGKYIDLATSGSVALMAVSATQWAIIASHGAVTWEP